MNIYFKVVDVQIQASEKSSEAWERETQATRGGFIIISNSELFRSVMVGVKYHCMLFSNKCGIPCEDSIWMNNPSCLGSLQGIESIIDPAAFSSS